MLHSDERRDTAAATEALVGPAWARNWCCEHPPPGTPLLPRRVVWPGNGRHIITSSHQRMPSTSVSPCSTSQSSTHPNNRQCSNTRQHCREHSTRQHNKRQQHKSSRRSSGAQRAAPPLQAALLSYPHIRLAPNTIAKAIAMKHHITSTAHHVEMR